MDMDTQSFSLLPLDWVEWKTRFLFFTGKGGVGKTTIASTVAVRLAEVGKRVLVVSTDPASNLDDVFALTAGAQVMPVPDVPGLFVMNLDPEAAAASYRERVIAPYRGVLPASAIRSMEEQLSGACTVEIAAFNEFTGLIATPARTEPFDQIIFDTAPTGHTLRLLSLPVPGVGLSPPIAPGRAAWVHWPDSKRSRPSISRPCGHWPMRHRPRCCW